MTRADESLDAAAIADRLCQAAGLAKPVALHALTGGKNNRVLRVESADGGVTVLKCYHHDPRDPRDRLEAEWSFLAYARARGIETVPVPLVRDGAAHAALYGWVEGRKLGQEELSAVHVAQALAFAVGLNQPPRAPLTLAAGSEACFSLAAHIATVDRRMTRLDGIERARPWHDAASDRVRVRLRPAWAAIRQRILDTSGSRGIELERTLTAQEMCVSPSDFGFHNALVAPSGQITFIDFEYAGQDDPAKLVCDFYCQPELTVPADGFSGFATGFAEGLGLDEDMLRRCHLLRDAYKIKWICIMLNEFLPVGASRRAFADPQAVDERYRAQLDKVDAALENLDF